MESSKPLLSVVVPVYKTEKYLRKCLDSIIGQTYRNLEVIIVDDGSPDNSSVIIQEYAEHDERIKAIFHEQNIGSFRARITGIEAAAGEYIGFVDSDDWISTDYYRVLINKITETDSDMLIADLVKENEYGQTEYYDRDPIRTQDLCITGEQVLDVFMKQRGEFYGWHVIWNKIYKKSFWDKCLPYFKSISSHLVMTDDIAYSCVIWSIAEKVTNAHGIYYFYLHHGEQSVAKGNLEKFEKNVSDVALVFDFFRDMLVKFDNWDKFEGDYNKFKELYIKHWCAYAKNFESEEFIKATEIIQKLFGISELLEITEQDNYIYRDTTKINIVEIIIPVEIKSPIDYGEFLAGAPKWKKALFLWLFDTRLFWDNIKRKNKK